MKKLSLICAILMTFFAINVNAQEKEKEVKSKIKSALVYLQGAELTRTAATQLKEGINYLKFTGLTNYADPNSIRIKGIGEFNILSVRHQLNYMQPQQQSKRVKNIQDSIKLFEKKIRINQRDQGILNTEEQMLKANIKIGGNENGMDVAALKEAWAFYSKRTSEIAKERFNLSEALTKIQEELQKLRNQLSQLTNVRRLPQSEVVVGIYAKKSTYARFSLKYLVNNAGWTPDYDLKAIDINKPIQLIFKAKIRQQTGIDWKNIKISLSTGNPRRNQILPTMRPWYLRPYARQRVAQLSKMKTERAMPLADEIVETDAEIAGNMSGYVNTQQMTTSTIYEVKLPYSVFSNGREMVAEVKQAELDASFKYYIIPKLDQAAYLMARITGWEELNLIPGSASIFFEGTYLGRTYINPNASADTMELSLGYDQNIVVKRERIKEFSSKSIFNDNIKQQVGWELYIKSKKAKAVDIVVMDQLPIPTTDKIEVKAKELSGAQQDNKTGKLSWKFKLDPYKSKTIIFKYQVKYPKNMQLNVH